MACSLRKPGMGCLAENGRILRVEPRSPQSVTGRGKRLSVVPSFCRFGWRLLRWAQSIRKVAQCPLLGLGSFRKNATLPSPSDRKQPAMGPAA